MAARTYIPRLRDFLVIIKKYIAAHRERLVENLGEGAFAVIELILDLVEVALAIMSSNSDANGDYGSAIDTLTSGQINDCQSAWDAFQAKVGGGA